MPTTAYSAGLASICDLNNDVAKIVSDDTYRITYKTDPDPITVSQPFAVHLLICDKDGVPFDGSLKVTATMPLHKHGMNFKPSISKISPGSFKATGLVFHMPGTWRYKFSLKGDGKTEHLTSDYIVQ